MKSFVDRLLSVFKVSNNKEYKFNDIHRVCMAASEELGQYCRLEGYNNR